MPRVDSTTELGKNDNLASPRDAGVVHTRTSIGKSLVLEEYVNSTPTSGHPHFSSGAVEIPEAQTLSHTLILRTGSPSVIEWKSDGRAHKAELAPGSVSLLPAGLRQAARITRPLPGVGLILQIDPVFFEHSVQEIAKGGRLELIRRMDLSDTQIARLMESLRADMAAGSPGGALFAESIAVALAAHVTQRYSTSTTIMKAHRGGLSRSRLNQVLEYIDANLSDNLELSVLAEVAGVNLHHFAKAFKQSAGETPHRFVLGRRIERAKEFLRHSQSSVIEASARTGFVDQSHFSKVFHRIVGVAPSEFRNSI
jgi:AraC family transcriptional regulator